MRESFRLLDGSRKKVMSRKKDGLHEGRVPREIRMPMTR